MLSKIYDEILSYFPENIKEKLNKCDSEILDKACEIRIRTGCPIIISYLEIFLTILSTLFKMNLIRVLLQLKVAIELEFQVQAFLKMDA